jgi:hypothetical protein
VIERQSAAQWEHCILTVFIVSSFANARSTGTRLCADVYENVALHEPGPVQRLETVARRFRVAVPVTNIMWGSKSHTPSMDRASAEVTIRI